MSVLNLACVGAGNWGRNLVRTFNSLPDVHLKMICDASEPVRKGMAAQYPDAQVVADYDDVLANSQITAVVLAVPAIDHFETARRALEAGKHVYVEKPISLSYSHACELTELAEGKGLTLMVGHLMEYHPGLGLLKQIVDDGELGDILYLYAERVNLGVVRKDENALWSLAPHDISMILHLLESEPETVSARGSCYLQTGVEDVVFVNMRFADGRMAQIQVSWLDPHKARKLTVVGTKKMVVFDDMESSEKVRIYDKAAEKDSKSGALYESYGESITLRFGDVVIPHINSAEPLKLEAQHFVECVGSGQTPRSDGRDGMRVVRVLEAAQTSLEADGVPTTLS
ncbi:MAG: Gfo/Idh/MocA family oxidoreductase [Gemmatimonadetes bacterium]|jgi:predicted dehydrogenase|nr:Gfo/Idh/MocA family oxidoreductase [Gemmatimonadota bacterium]MBT6144731.1 Gfo/Idh/MocA family oxidoreductase [Gemmatimonadota bacterium]MBT7862705.1 Gfo/Idh/MocA family oxidoreductase [Gemmatimonadota bacterium]